MMNYEVNPFQDYESITVDELKDQANSLLNLVTEERRQLPLPAAGLCDASHRPLLSFTAFSRPCRSVKEPLLSNTSGPSAAWNASDYKSKRPAPSSRPFHFYSSSRNRAALSMAAAAFLMGNI